LYSPVLYDIFAWNLDASSYFLQNYGNCWLVLRRDASQAFTNKLLILSIAFEAREFSVLEQKVIDAGMLKVFALDEKDANKFVFKFCEKREGEGFVDFMVRGSVTEDMVSNCRIFYTEYMFNLAHTNRALKISNYMELEIRKALWPKVFRYLQRSSGNAQLLVNGCGQWSMC
jgi:hypothetical protein